MTKNHLYSIILEMTATKKAVIPSTTGNLAHALFLDLVRQADPALSVRLHDEPGFRPFTVSPLSGGRVQGDDVFLKEGDPCRLRLTLLDGGALWQCLSTRFLEMGSVSLRLGTSEFCLNRLLATPGSDARGWAGFAGWQTLVSTQPNRYLTLTFASPTAFHLGERRFALFPEPVLLWDSLLRVWNLYAPEALKIDKTPLQEFVKTQIQVTDYSLQTQTLKFPKFVQKGFTGSCTYHFREQGELASQAAALAEFALYSGVGYKTTMGMGQARLHMG